MQPTLEISVFWPIPTLAWERFASVRRTVNFALEKNELPVTWVFQLRLCLLHRCPSFTPIFSLFDSIMVSHVHYFGRSRRFSLCDGTFSFATRIPGYTSNLNLLQGAELIEVISEAFEFDSRGNEK
jgi:hypothetical protein